MIKFDPQASNPELKSIFDAVDQEVQERLGEFYGRMGYCHVFWAEKKRVLKEKYGIDWKTPVELNLGVLFD